MLEIATLYIEVCSANENEFMPQLIDMDLLENRYREQAIYLCTVRLNDGGRQRSNAEMV